MDVFFYLPKKRKKYHFAGVLKAIILDFFHSSMNIDAARKSLCCEIGSQTAKASFGVCAVITLVLINNNLHQLVSCLSKPIADSQPTNQPPLHHATPQNCNASSIGRGTLECCPTTIRLYYSNRIVFAYSRTSAPQIAGWLKACHKDMCPISFDTGRHNCIAASRWSRRDYLCFDDHKNITFGVLSGVRFNARDIHAILDFVTNRCFLR
jgi:hypothetical protein